MALTAKPDLQLGRVHVHVHFARRQVEKHADHGVAVARQQRPVGIVKRLAKRPALHGPLIDKKELLPARGAMKRCPGNEASDAHRIINMLNIEKLILQPGSQKHVQPFA
jgi:hypothetical protein